MGNDEGDIEAVDPWMVARDAIVAMRKGTFRRRSRKISAALKDASLRGRDAQPFVLRHQELMKMIHDVETGTLFKSA